MSTERPAHPRQVTAPEVDPREEVRYRGFVAMVRALPPDSSDNPIGIPANRVLELTTTPDPPPGYVLERVPYGTAGAAGRELHLMLYRPLELGAARPGVIFIHGGAWRAGFPELEIRHAHELAARGWVAASIAYRLSGEAPWPAALEDAKCAVRWMRANATRLGVDPGRIVVSGGSSGGHLGAMVALTPGRFEGTGGCEEHSSAVSAAVLFCAVTDMRRRPAVPMAESPSSAFLGPEADERVRSDASPIDHVRGDAPPILSMVGGEDSIAPPEMAKAFHGRLIDAGATSELEIYPGLGHAFAWLRWSETIDRMVGFLERHVGSPRSS